MADILRAILSFWIYTYLGPLYFQVVEKMSIYSRNYIKYALEADVKFREADPIIVLGTFCRIYRYHAPLRSAYKRIRATLYNQTSNNYCLEMAVLVFHSTLGTKCVPNDAGIRRADLPSMQRIVLNNDKIICHCKQNNGIGMPGAYKTSKRIYTPT